ncbi:pyruvate kinase [Minwuia sp.]|uniref:pyruvate kinase n=1 Tax=Minwuia sp. TaxID=2493630 RepID=UPI003A955F44
MHRNRQTKILATLGPGTSTAARIAKLFDTGVDVFRFNFSHGSHADHRKRHRIVRALEEARGRPIGILADLQGPKLRIGAFENGRIEIKRGQKLRLDLDDKPGTAKRVQLPHPEIFEAMEVGSTLLLDDGRVRLKVLDHDAKSAETEVISGSALSNNKGVNVPDMLLNLAALSDKDRKDLDFAISLGVDWLALSFVQRADDIAEARKLTGGQAHIMAKIEKPSAVEHIDDILEIADGIMVARGDLGVETPVVGVPSLQKALVRTARSMGKTVVVATQMLESMVTSPFPTRAEVSDVATAVYDGADAVMLSAETAVGDFPNEAVATMDGVIEATENDKHYRAILEAEHAVPEATAADAITAAARQVAETIKAAAVVTYTTSGSTTLRAARERPSMPILCLTPKQETSRRLTLSWGVRPVLTDDASNMADMVERACRIALREDLAKPGQRLVITAGVPFGTPGATNILRIAWVDG